MDKVSILCGRAGQTLPRIVPDIGACRAEGGRVLMLVPEQYTLQAERELVERLHLPGLLDLDVLSPSRLRRRVREAGGRDPLAPLDEKGRRMALYQALIVTRPHLTYYARVAQSPGLTEKVSAALSDMQRAGMTPEELGECAARLPQGAARAKEEDLRLIWEEYLRLTQGRFSDEAGQEQETIRRLAGSKVVEDASLWVYGFDMLSEPLCELICEAAHLARRVTVAMTMDAKDAPDGRIFLTQRRSVADLIQRLDARAVPWSMRYLPASESPDKAPALRFLDRCLFARGTETFSGDASCLTLHAAANPFAEAAYAAKTLRAWHEEGIPWQRMAVALSDAGALSGVMAVTLKTAGIPHYLARKDSALRHGLCRMLLGALRSATGGFLQADVLDVIKSGFSPLTESEALALENYALENGVRGGKWLRPFDRGEDAEVMDKLRERVTAPLVRLKDALRAAGGAGESMEAVYRLLEDTGAYASLLAREEELLRRGMQAEAAQNRQVWQLILTLLDQLYALLGDRRAAMKDVARFVESGLTSATISSLPPSPDAVMVGEAGHLMTGHVEALVVMGMQDGVMGSAADSLLSESERTALSLSAHRMIGLTRKEQAALRQADFYRTLTLPDRRLAVTFSEGTQDGAALRPAGLIDDLRRLYPSLRVSGGVTADGTDDPPLSPLQALEGLAIRLRAMADGHLAALDEDWQEALRYLWHSERYGARMRQVAGSLSARVDAGELKREQAARLFGQDSVSISRLEEFAACPYRHFVDYGLKPVKRRPFAFEADEKGSFFHDALHDYATLASALPAWPDVPDDTVDRLMDQVLSPLEKTWEGGPLREDPLGESLGRSLERTVRRAAWLFTRHARNSRFTTVGAEVAFGQEGGLPPVILTLAGGRQVALRGIIDRIDRFDGDKGVYLRVVDYKSSRHLLDPIRMWYGLQLQLLLYLDAATQEPRGALPAGAFYFTVDDPLVDSPEDVKAAAEDAIARELRLKGVVLAETEVVDAMDADVPGLSLGKVFNADDTTSSNASALNLAQMRALLDHARDTAASLADGIRQGQIGITPAQIGSWSACDYCDYASVCRLDPTLPGGEKRVLCEPDRQEFLARLTKEDKGQS